MNLEQYAEHFYQHKENYKIIDNPDAAEPDLCAVFFSSVGLYSEKNFAARLDADYYEFPDAISMSAMFCCLFIWMGLMRG